MRVCERCECACVHLRECTHVWVFWLDQNHPLRLNEDLSGRTEPGPGAGHLDGLAGQWAVAGRAGGPGWGAQQGPLTQVGVKCVRMHGDDR